MLGQKRNIYGKRKYQENPEPKRECEIYILLIYFTKILSKTTTKKKIVRRCIKKAKNV